jgi:hypothetical protein
MTLSLAARLQSVALVAALAACDSSQSARSQPQPAPSEVSASTPASKLRIEDAPASGDVDTIVRVALSTAERERRRVVVYVGATWCEPCQRFHEAAQAGELDVPFPNVNILVFDADRDVRRLNAAGYAWKKYIPLFALPGPDGRASGQQFEGGIKGDGAVSFLTPRLLALLQP